VGLSQSRWMGTRVSMMEHAANTLGEPGGRLGSRFPIRGRPQFLPTNRWQITFGWRVRHLVETPFPPRNARTPPAAPMQLEPLVRKNRPAPPAKESTKTSTAASTSAIRVCRFKACSGHGLELGRGC